MQLLYLIKEQISYNEHNVWVYVLIITSIQLLMAEIIYSFRVIKTFPGITEVL